MFFLGRNFLLPWCVVAIVATTFVGITVLAEDPVTVSATKGSTSTAKVSPSTIKPSATTVKPSAETTTVKQPETTTVKPSAETTVKPSLETAVKPSPETTVKPSAETTTVKPPATTVKPLTTTVKPSAAATAKPPTTTVKPSAETTVKPVTTTITPSAAATVKPSPETTVKPLTTTITPSAAATVKPSPETTVKPLTTTITPSAAATVKPSPETTVTPPTTTVTPSAAATVKPSSETTVTPPTTTVTPSATATVKPSSETTVTPPTTTVTPSATATVKPSSETTVTPPTTTVTPSATATVKPSSETTVTPPTTTVTPSATATVNPSPSETKKPDSDSPTAERCKVEKENKSKNLSDEEQFEKSFKQLSDVLEQMFTLAQRLDKLKNCSTHTGLRTDIFEAFRKLNKTFKDNGTKFDSGCTNVPKLTWDLCDQASTKNPKACPPTDTLDTEDKPPQVADSSPEPVEGGEATSISSPAGVTTPNKATEPDNKENVAPMASRSPSTNSNTSLLEAKNAHQSTHVFRSVAITGTVLFIILMPCVAIFCYIRRRNRSSRYKSFRDAAYQMFHDDPNPTEQYPFSNLEDSDL